MTRFTRIKAAFNWGLFIGACLWLLSTNFEHRETPTWGVWAMVMSKALTGVVLALLHDKYQWWLRGITVGTILNLPLAFIALNWHNFNNAIAFIYMVISGTLAGFFIELAVKHYEKELANAAAEAE